MVDSDFGLGFDFGLGCDYDCCGDYEYGNGYGEIGATRMRNGDDVRGVGVVVRLLGWTLLQLQVYGAIRILLLY